MPTQTIFVQGRYYYLWVMGQWYCYDSQAAPIGSGAMGDVYLGYRCIQKPQGMFFDMNCKVAVKRVKDCYANVQMIRDRARLEANLAYRHQNLVEMIGMCELNPYNGPLFLISKYVEGENVDTYLQKYTNTENRVEKICRIGCSVLDALSFIHSKGLIHRDVKPSNIMIEAGSSVRLMDLGISKLNGGNKFSQYGFIGTPQYSAPEQIKRKKPEMVAGENSDESDDINATTDIYELGITLYELFTGKNPMSCLTEADTLAKQLTEPLPADDAIPKRLMRVLWKATEKKQDKRYQSAEEFKNAILQALAPEPPLFDRIGDFLGDHIKTILVSIILIAVAAILTILIQPIYYGTA